MGCCAAAPRGGRRRRGSFHAKQPPEIRGGGYVVQALEAALWALLKTRTFEDGVLAAVNLGDDADTTAAIFGQLAGACYGVEAIPAHWREQVIMREQILQMAEQLHALAQTIDPDAPLASPSGSTRALRSTDIAACGAISSRTPWGR